MMGCMTVTVRFYDSRGKFLEAREVEADPGMPIAVPPAPPEAARFVASWPQQTGDLGVLASSAPARTIHVHDLA
jgi:hypothetical protein